MRKYNYESERQFKNILGGTIRWALVYVYNTMTKKEKPDRSDFVIGVNKEEDYFGHVNTQHRNTIATIITLFIICSLIFKLFFL